MANTVISHEQAQWDDIDWHYLASFTMAEVDVGEACQASITWQAQSAIL